MPPRGLGVIHPCGCQRSRSVEVVTVEGLTSAVRLQTVLVTSFATGDGRITDTRALRHQRIRYPCARRHQAWTAWRSLEEGPAKRAIPSVAQEVPGRRGLQILQRATVREGQMTDRIRTGWIGRRAAARVAVLGLALVLAIGTASCAESDSFEFKPRGHERPCQGDGC